MTLNVESRNIPKFISFFGVDGAGKTTQVMMLSKIFDREKVNYKKVWIRSPHGLAFYIWKILIKIGFSRVTYNKFGSILKIPNFKSYSKLSVFWGWFELLNIMPIVFFKAIIPYKIGYSLLAERYTPDSIATISYFLSDDKFINSKVSLILLSLIPKDAMFIYLKCDYQELIRRRKIIVEPKQSSNFHSKIYDLLAYQLKAVVIDTSNLSILDTHKKIIKSVFKNKIIKPINYEIKVPQPDHSLQI